MVAEQTIYYEEYNLMPSYLNTPQQLPCAGVHSYPSEVLRRDTHQETFPLPNSSHS